MLIRIPNDSLRFSRLGTSENLSRNISKYFTALYRNVQENCVDSLGFFYVMKYSSEYSRGFLEILLDS